MGITTSPIVVHLDTIGMDDYLASDDQAKTVFHALQAYGFLLTHQPPKGVLRRYTFAEFAAVIEMNYDVTSRGIAKLLRCCARCIASILVRVRFAPSSSRS